MIVSRLNLFISTIGRHSRTTTIIDQVNAYRSISIGNVRILFFTLQLEAPFVLYATGVLCSWITEQERAELTQYVYDALLLVAKQKLSIQALQAIYAELG
jgi:hypothetical protein